MYIVNPCYRETIKEQKLLYLIRGMSLFLIRGTFSFLIRGVYSFLIRGVRGESPTDLALETLNQMTDGHT